MKILILQGPGMRLLGADLLAGCDAAALDARLRREAAALGVELTFFQSNSEGALLDFLEGQGGDDVRALLFPTTLAQNGLALRQEMRLLSLPAVEVHFDPELAKSSILKPLCLDQFVGLDGAIEGLRTLARVRLDPLASTHAARGSRVAPAERPPAKTLGRRKASVTKTERAVQGTARPRKTLGRK